LVFLLKYFFHVCKESIFLLDFQMFQREIRDLFSGKADAYAFLLWFRCQDPVFIHERLLLKKSISYGSYLGSTLALSLQLNKQVPN
jgi:hypothetical protein